jgi:hypothetical protein
MTLRKCIFDLRIILNGVLACGETTTEIINKSRPHSRDFLHFNQNERTDSQWYHCLKRS